MAQVNLVRRNAEVATAPQTNIASHTRLNIGFILAPSFTLSAFSNFVDAIRLAADDEDHSRQKLCGWSVIAPTLEPIVSSCGISVNPTKRLSDDFSHIVVVGGLVRGHKQIHPEIIPFLRAACHAGRNIISLCTGSFLLAEAGLLNGKRCCVHWFHLDEFMESYPDLKVQSHRLFIRDGRITTSAGGMASMDLAVGLIAETIGADRARKVEHGLLMPEARGEQYPQIKAHLSFMGEIRDGRLRRAVAFIVDHVADDLSAQMIADHICVSIPTLGRMFHRQFGQAPQKIICQIRMAEAHWHLINAGASISVIAMQVGFSSVSNFARAFRKQYGMPPSRLRAHAKDGISNGIDAGSPIGGLLSVQ